MKKIIKIGYKVVCSNMSSWCRDGKSDGEIKYKIKKWVKPHKGFGPLAVFGNSTGALKMKSRGDKVYKCYYVPSKQKWLWDKRGNRSGGWPGTRYADAVKLIKKVR